MLMNQHYLNLQALQFSIDDFRLTDIDISVRKGEYHVVLGPTGSGKSTLMKCILGLYRPSGGSITLDDNDLLRLPPEKRGLGYLPQNYALFPHLSVEGNIRFGLHSRRLPAAAEEKEVTLQCDALQIGPLRGRDVRTLSGGEQQKVALARALITRPKVILLDEPFSSIDEGSRRRLWFDLKQAIRRAGVTAIHITHHLEEAYTLGDRLSVLVDGRLVQSGRKEVVFGYPATESVARFLGYRNIFYGDSRNLPGGTAIDLGYFLVKTSKKIPAGERVAICLRPQYIKIIREDEPIRESLERNVFKGEVISIFMLPEHCLMRFQISGSPSPFDLELKFPAYIKERLSLSVGKKITVALWEPSIIVFRGH
jgi:ABC-type Fe3+/spermidine/putrescine transport system ATPase subunit